MRTISLPSQSRIAGRQTLNLPVTIAKRFTALGCRISRESLPSGVDYTLSNGVVIPNTAFVITMEKTVDDGATWEEFYSGTFPGGVQTDRSGNTLLFNSPFVFFRDIEGVLMTVSGDTRIIIERLITLRCSVDATMFEQGDINAGIARR